MKKLPRIEITDLLPLPDGPSLAMASIRLPALGISIRGLRLVADPIGGYCLQGPQFSRLNADGRREYQTFACFDAPLRKAILTAILSDSRLQEASR